MANYIYDGDAPLAERRAQALSIDQEQLRDLLGDADLRELLDSDAIGEVEEQLQGAARNSPRALDRALRENFFSRLKVMFYAGASLSQTVWDEIAELSFETCGERIAMLTGLGGQRPRRPPYSRRRRRAGPVPSACRFPASS